MKIKEWIIPIGCITTIIIIGALLAGTMLQSQYDTARKKTLQEIDDIQASDEYKQGWTDALKRMDAWYHAPVNTTMAA